jgi:hypothetical protein
MTTLTFASALALAGLLAQAAPEGGPSSRADHAEAAPAQAAAQPDNDLANQLDGVLAAPAPPSESRKASSPAGGGLMNPDISAIFDGVAGAASRPRASSAGDDPAFGGPADKRTGGFAIQEIEIGLQSTIDPYLAAKVYLTIPNLEGIEVEEAYATTTSLPFGLQIKAGIFRSAAGRQNEQHLHMQDFSLRPLINQAYLGVDGLRQPGVQLSWLLPLPFFLRLTAEAISVAPGDNPTFGGSLRSSPTVLGNLKTFVPIGESWSLFLGATTAAGHASSRALDQGEPLTSNGPRSLLAGGDLYLKYMPPNRVASYFALALQAEYFWRRLWADGDTTSDAGFYAQLVAQLSRRFHTGVRFDQVGLPASTVQAKGARMSAMAMFTPSEFSRVRVQVQREKVDQDDAIFEALLLLEFSIGAHGAHPF